MNIKVIDRDFCICKVQDMTQVDLQAEYCFLSKTDEEISLVCTADSVPVLTTAKDSGWKAFRIQGILDFSLVGILSRISALLAERNISIFAVSTYNTDYFFLKNGDFNNSIAVLKEHGFTIE